MLTADQIDALRDLAEEIAHPITEALLREIAQRLADAGQLTATAADQIRRAQTLGLSQAEIKRRLQKLLDRSEQEIEALLTQSAQVGYDFDIKQFPTAQAIPFAENFPLQQILHNAVKLAQEDFSNLTQTLGMIDPYGNPQPLQKAYHSCMDLALEQVATGTDTLDSALRKATKNLADYGIRVIDYQSGVHRSLEAAARGCILGGMGLLQEQISQENHDKLDANGWEISAHGACAPDHEDIQGRQYSDEEYEKLNHSLQRRIGTLNCGHAAFPIRLGVQRPAYSPEELAEMKRKNAQGITYQGKHYTTYEATQKQRQIERALRKQKNRILVDESLGDTEKLATDQIRLGRLQEEYIAFSKAAGLRTQTERARVAGFGTKQASSARKTYTQAKKAEKVFTPPGKRDILKETKIPPIPVTTERVKNVPLVPCETLSVPLQRKLQNEHKRLLLSVSGKPLGTEGAVTYSLEMKLLHKVFGADGQSSVKIPHESVPYISIHNHPSGGTFTHTDIRVFVRDENMVMLTAVGNDGTVYIAEKTKDFSLEKYEQYYASLLLRHPRCLDSVDEYRIYMNDFLEGVDSFGLHYYSNTRVAGTNEKMVGGTSDRP